MKSSGYFDVLPPKSEPIILQQEIKNDCSLFICDGNITANYAVFLDFCQQTARFY
jgi:hypothetical protein